MWKGRFELAGQGLAALVLILLAGSGQAQETCPSTSSTVEETYAVGQGDGITPPGGVALANAKWQNPRILLAAFAERARTTIEGSHPGCGFVITDNGSNAPDNLTGGTVKLAATKAPCYFTNALPLEFRYEVNWRFLRECPTGYSLAANGYSCNPQEHNLLACAPSVSPATIDPARTVGECTDGCFKGNPINVATGNKLQREADLQTFEPDAITFVRYYNSSPLLVASKMGPGWRHTFDRQLVLSGDPAVSSTTSVIASVLRPDGRIIRFGVSGAGVISTYPDVVETLIKQNDGTWVFTDGNDTVETYLAPTAIGGGQYSAVLNTIRFRSGVTQTLSYDSNSRPLFVLDSFGNSLELVYDIQGRLYQVNDAEGNMIQYGYNSTTGMLNRVYYPGPTKGSITGAPYRTYSYSQPAGLSWYLSNIADESGSVTSRWEYDSEGRVTKGAKTSSELEVYNYSYANGMTTVTALNGALTASETYSFQTIQGIPRLTAYSGKEGISIVRDPLTGRQQSRTQTASGSQTIMEYDTRGRVTRRTEAASTARARTTTYKWHPTLHVPTEIAQYANSTGTGIAVRVQSFSLDTNGNVTAYTDEAPLSSPGVSRTWSITRNSYGRPLVVDGPGTYSDIVRHTYYNCTTGFQCGKLKTYTNERGKLTSYSDYTVLGLPRTVVDPNGTTTALDYDLRGRLVTQTEGGESTAFSYWPNGLLKRVTLPDDSWTERTYNAAHWLTLIADQADSKIVYGRDVRGNPNQVKYKNAAGITWLTLTRTYDEYSRLIQEKSATKSAGITNYLYDGAGHLESATAALGRGTSYGYDELGRVKRTTSPVSLNKDTFIEYDLADRVTQVTDPRNVTTEYQYDGFGALTQLLSPDTGTTTYSYNPIDGRPTTSVDARGVTTSHEFDSMGRPSANTWPGTGQLDKFYYDEGVNGINHMSRATSNDSNLAWTYDGNGRVLSKTQTVGALTMPSYYAYTNARLTSLTTPSGQGIAYGYPAGHGGRPRSVSVNGVEVLSGVSYYPYGPVMYWVWAHGLTESRTRNGDGLPNATNGTAGTGSTLFYDDALRINGQTIAGNTAASWNLGYDLKDQLTTATPVSGQALGWGYDDNGNRSSQAGAAPSNYGYATNSNRLTSLDGISIGSDNVGNITNGGNGTTFTYGPRNRMTSAMTATGTTTYSYNALGERVKKSGPGGTVVFAYDEEGHLIGEYDGAGTMIQEIVWFEGLPVATLRPASGGGIQIFNISADHLDTPRVIRRAADGVVVWRWDSDPFGVASPNENPSGAGEFKFNLRFPGQYADAETGLNYNYFRDYNPKTGRYTQSDPIGLRGGLNTFTYTESRPTERSDPYGLATCTYSIFHHTLICTSNNLKAEATVGPVGVHSGSGFKENLYCKNNPACQNIKEVGPVSEGTYSMRASNKFGGSWWLDGGSANRVLCKLGLARCGYFLHLGSISEGCITVEKDNVKAKDEFEKIRSILRNDSNNVLRVVSW